MRTAKPAASGGVTPSHDVYWRETQPVQPGPALGSDLDCDICIVGAGYTGMWSALFLKGADPGLDIHVLEAGYAGSGASGHNDGFATGAIGGQSWLSLARRYGPEPATAAHRSVARSILEIHRFCAGRGIDIDIEPLGFYAVATSRRQDRRLASEHAMVAQMKPAANNPPILGPAAMQARIGSPAITSGVWRAGMLINPHKLALGLARSARESGVAIHEQTPVLTLSDNGRSVLLRTPSAMVRARHVVLATNAWQSQFPWFRRKVMARWHYVLVTAPLREADLAALQWTGREGFIEVRRPGFFGRLTADNRILFGGGSSGDFRDIDAEPAERRMQRVERALRQNFARYFPMLDGIPITHFYGGAMGVTPDRMPSVGTIADRITYAYGFSGNGIPVTHTVGQLVRDLVLEKGSPDWAKVFIRADAKRFPAWPVTNLASVSRSYYSRISGA